MHCVHQTPVGLGRPFGGPLKGSFSASYHRRATRVAHSSVLSVVAVLGTALCLTLIQSVSCLGMEAASPSTHTCAGGLPSEHGEVVTDSPPFYLHFLNRTSSMSQALCLDGSPAAYYFLPGSGTGANKWFIFHQGGGWCESEDDCFNRAGSTLGSSLTYPPTSNLGAGYLSSDPTVNPQMYNWNKVFLMYCDGGSFSGANTTTTVVNQKPLHFHGKFILDAAIEEMQVIGIKQATDVVIAGCSAGGLATYLHSNKWAAALPPTAHVVAMPDSGFFIDYEDPARPKPSLLGTTLPGNYHDGLVWVFNTMNATSGVDQACIDAQDAADSWRCMFAEHTSPYIRIPVFPLQSEYDAWQTGHVLYDGANPARVQDLGDMITYRMKVNLFRDSKNGGWIDSCHHHCGEWRAIHFDGLDSATAFQKWYEAPGTPPFFQNQPYPCEKCCH